MSKFIFIFIVCNACFLSAAIEDDSRLYFRLGIKYRNSGEYAKALEQFNKLQSLDPTNPVLFYEIGMIYKHQGNYDKAKSFFVKALSYKANFDEAQYELALTNERLGQLEEASSDWRNYLKMVSAEDKINNAQYHIEKIQSRKAILDRLRQKSLREGKYLTEQQLDSLLSVYYYNSERRKKSLFGEVKDLDSAGRISVKQMKLSAEDHYKRGLYHKTVGQFSLALEHFQQAVKLRPTLWGAYFHAGIIRMRQEDYDKAIVNFNKALGDKVQWHSAYFYLGLIEAKKQSYADAITQFKKYIQISDFERGKQEAYGHIERLQELLDIENARKTARTAYLLSKIRSKRSPPPHFYYYPLDNQLGLVIEDTLFPGASQLLEAIQAVKYKKFDEGIRRFKKIILMNEENPLKDDAIYNVGICYMKLKLFENARNQFDFLMEQYPHSELGERALYFKSAGFLYNGEYTDAEYLLEKFVKLYPESEYFVPAHIKKSESMLAQNDFARSIKLYEQITRLVESTQEKMDLYYNIAEVYRKQQMPRKAIENFKRMVAYDSPDTVIIPLTQGLADTIVREDSLETVYPVIREAYFSLADLYYEQKQWEEALRYYHLCKNKFPQDKDQPWVLYQMGNIYRKKTAFKEALAAYDQVLRNYPDSFWAEQSSWKKKDVLWTNEYFPVLNR